MQIKCRIRYTPVRFCNYENIKINAVWLENKKILLWCSVIKSISLYVWKYKHQN